MVEVHGARKWVWAGPLLEDHHRPATLRELDAENQTDRAGADDDDVCVGRIDGAHPWRRAWWPQALMAS